MFPDYRKQKELIEEIYFWYRENSMFDACSFFLRGFFNLFFFHEFGLNLGNFPLHCEKFDIRHLQYFPRAFCSVMFLTFNITVFTLSSAWKWFPYLFSFEQTHENLTVINLDYKMDASIVPSKIHATEFARKNRITAHIIFVMRCSDSMYNSVIDWCNGIIPYYHILYNNILSVVIIVLLL